ncbi:MAG: endopeptidase La [Anaerolineales bacterium]|nr:endopeptidase La [Anaerolineales bacterium]
MPELAQPAPGREPLAVEPAVDPLRTWRAALSESSFIPVQHEGEPEAPPVEALLTEDIPKEIPILPLRGLVVYPHTAVPLTIGQPRSIKLVDEVAGSSRVLGLVASKNPELDQPGPADLYTYGTVGMIQRLFRAPDGTIRLIVHGLTRFRLEEFTSLEPYLKARVALMPETVEAGLEMEAQVRAAKDQFQKIAELAPALPREIISSVLMLEDPLHVAYTITNYQRMELAEAQAILEEDSALAKLKRLNSLLGREVEVLSLGQQIQQQARTEIEKVQREYFLREQLKAIQRELGEGDEQAAEAEEFRQKLAAAGMPEEAEKQARRELDRLTRLPTAAAEYGVIRTYLDWLVSLPWAATTQDNLELAHARAVLDADHYALQDVKQRILEYLAVRKLRQERKAQDEVPSTDEIRREREGVILCFVGPPGVGKTSLGRSIARAMNRKFIRASLGGVHDEAEIRGHRRTYIGALPGRILQALRRIESRNPVFMLDEIDKLGQDFRGDPASALLEVLDPEQNREFRDHYLEVAFDLSQVMFITTANWLETIPAPLLDRMEVIQISGYTEWEKIAIARGYLVPRQLRENGLATPELSLTDAALGAIIRSYTREAGVRNLERAIGRVARKVATEVAEGKSVSVTVDANQLAAHLGKPRFFGTEELAERTSLPGVAAGLAWTPAGGDVLFVEATAMPGGKDFQLTGSLGQVMQESARAAMSYVRSVSKSIGIADSFWKTHDIHLHIPAGAQPKDGPSAGVTMAVALASLATGRPVRSDVGMTGEITLRGKVLPIGGVKEKVLAAHRAELRQVILPKRNEADLDDVPEEIRRQMDFALVDTVGEVLDASLEARVPTPRKRTAGRRPGRGVKRNAVAPPRPALAVKAPPRGPRGPSRRKTSSGGRKA